VVAVTNTTAAVTTSTALARANGAEHTLVLTNWARQAESGLLGLFIAAMVWTPMPLASNRPWSMAVLAAWLWVLLALILVVQGVQACRPHAVPRGQAQRSELDRTNPLGSTRGALGVAALLGAFGLWAALPLLGWGSTASPFDTQVYLLQSCTYVAGFLLVQRLVTTPRRRLIFMYGLLLAGVLQALLALILFAAGGKHEVFGYISPHASRATGTFANADHLAHYMVMMLAVGIGLMLSQMGQAKAMAQSWKDRVAGAMRFMMSPKMLIRLLLVLLVITLVLTRSRAGNGEFFIALFLLCGWVMVTSPRLRKPAALLVVSLLVVDLIVVGQWVGLDKVVQRLEATDLARQEADASGVGTPTAAPAYREETLEERLRAATSALELVRQQPWRGHGAGTFYTTFPGVKSPESKPRFDHAHNDYVELAADTGLVGLALLGCAFVLTGWRLIRLMGDRTPALDRGLAAGLGMGLLCAALHAAVDFTLHTTANALTVTILMAMAWTVPLPQRAPIEKTGSGT